jgi:antitoxin MazE
MRAQVQKWGNSLALRIPRSFAAETSIEQGSEVELSLEDGKLIMTPIEKSTYSLDALLAGVTKDNLHNEIDSGPSVGKEAW